MPTHARRDSQTWALYLPLLYALYLPLLYPPPPARPFLPPPPPLPLLPPPLPPPRPPPLLPPRAACRSCSFALSFLALSTCSRDTSSPPCVAFPPLPPPRPRPPRPPPRPLIPPCSTLAGPFAFDVPPMAKRPRPRPRPYDWPWFANLACSTPPT